MEAVELAASLGLFLYDWQQWVLARSLAERPDGAWAAMEVGLWVPRQNGKGSILEAREAAGLLLFDEQLIIHSAHEFKTAREHFLRMQTLVDSNPEFSAKVKAVYTANGQESIVMRSGARLVFAARSGGSGRGFTADTIVYDEAFALSAAAVGAMLPTLATIPNPQVWYTSSAAKASSEVMHSLNKRARSADPGRLWLADWCVSEGRTREDRDGWYEANPSLGIRISEEFVETELAALRDLGTEFERERMNVHEAPDLGAGVFGPGVWAACADPDSQMVDLRAVALDVSPGMAWASFAAAGTNQHGLPHVDLIRKDSGTGWVAQEAARIGQKVWIDPRSPAAALVRELRNAGVDVEEMPAGEFPRACVSLQEQVTAGKVRHLGDPKLDAAQAGAAIRTAGDSWVWGRATSSVDISPLVAVTVALWAAFVPVKKKPVFAY